MPTISSPPSSFALLDDCESSDTDRRSRLYTDLIDVIDCGSGEELAALLARLQQELGEGLHAVGLFDYELGADLLRIDPASMDRPLARILLFAQCRQCSFADVDHWLNSLVKTPHPSGIADLHANVPEAGFIESIEKIHDYIRAGDVYQVNYTYRMRFDAYGSPPALYLKLRARQPVPYGALIMLPDGEAILSFSPELFVRHRQGSITARPMKGTAPAGAIDTENAQRSDELAVDSKNRAENLMIVDLLRNDLGRIATVGSVRVPTLFQVSRFGSVLQMTSTIQAQLQEGTGIANIFSAIFPCGSITGAPKIRAMQIIHELETDRRGLYTGAIGWFDPPDGNRAIGDFCLSVPIRTLTLGAPEDGGVREGEMGVGAGIVHDSNARLEYEECLLKAAFMADLPAGFDLFETILATRSEGCRHIDRHMQRLGASAHYFGFRFDEAGIRQRLDSVCSGFLPDTTYRMRVSLGKDGLDVQSSILQPLSEPVRLLLAEEATSPGDLFLRHKTTVRTRYDSAFREAEEKGAFDMLFFNSRGELTEGGRSNVFVRLEGQWFTPPISSGVLPGVMRSILLEDAAWNARERCLTVDDLRYAEQIVVTNALRGAIKAEVVWND